MKRKPAAKNWPIFDSPLLQDIANAFQRRRKAIANHGGLSCERVFDESANGVFERLHLDAVIMLNESNLSLSVWSDGVMWLGVWARGFGRGARWAFKDSFHGDVQDIAPRTLLRMVEATQALWVGEDPVKEHKQLRDLWARVRPRSG